VEIELTDEERETLVRWSRRHSSSQALALRSRIVLACADGRPNPKIADELGCDRVTVGKWRHRFAAERLEGLVDAPRPGAVRTISDEVVEAVVVETLESTPKDATHWSTRNQPATSVALPTTRCPIRSTGTAHPLVATSCLHGDARGPSLDA
jgi:hypothetical protein